MHIDFADLVRADFLTSAVLLPLVGVVLVMQAALACWTLHLTLRM
jgi:hypothetical protein